MSVGPIASMLAGACNAKARRRGWDHARVPAVERAPCRGPGLCHDGRSKAGKTMQNLEHLRHELHEHEANLLKELRLIRPGLRRGDRGPCQARTSGEPENA